MACNSARVARVRVRHWARRSSLVARANNASFAAQAAYDELVPAFEALFEREGRDWSRFYDAVRQLTQQPQPERHAALRALTPSKEKPGV